jgi:hypothetical protein
LINNKIKEINVDIISDNLGQTASSFISAFRFYDLFIRIFFRLCILQYFSNKIVNFLRFLRKQAFFKILDRQNYVIFCDCGSHFRNYQSLFYFFHDLAKENIGVCKIKYNFNYKSIQKIKYNRCFSE